MSITAEQRDAWVAALRSGAYQQGTLCLYWSPTTAYCCLGVFARAVLGIQPRELINRQELRDLRYYELPFKVERRLAELNDSGVTFAQIADLLENAGDPALWA